MPFLSGCTDLGDIIVIDYKIQGESLSLSDLDGDFLPKESLGKSPYCHTRRSSIDTNKWMGVCFNKSTNKITVYRTFRNKYNIEKKGITKEVLNSSGFEELEKITSGIDSVLKHKKIKFEKFSPKYTPFQKLHEEFKFTR